MSDKRVILFDLEVFHLNWGADLGTTICMGWKVLGENKVHMESLADLHGKDLLDDGPLVKRCKEILEDADMWITYNGLRFDVPWLQTRLLLNKQQPLAPVAHKDLYPTMRFKFKFSRNSLHNVQEAMGLDNSKTPVRLLQWLHLLAGRKTPWKEIQEHCKNDVLVLEEAYERVKPWMMSHPHLFDYEGCSTCGSALQSRGFYLSAGTKYPKQRLWCPKCPKWTTKTLTKAEWQKTKQAKNGSTRKI